MSLCGVLLALSVLCMLLGSVLETNTLFLLAAAAFFVGIIYREFGKHWAAAFWLAGVLLGAVLSPEKFYVLTYGCMGLYLLLIEWCWEFLGPKTISERKKRNVFIGMKYLIFNLMFLPVLFLFQKLLFTKTLTGVMLLGIVLAGQAGLFLYDRAYEYVQRCLWGKIRKYINE